MSVPLNYCNIADLPDEISTDEYEPKFINIEERNGDGDELLIELYKERSFLYDKNNISFKDRSMKQKAWIEMSKIMKTNYGNTYTPLYCQKRCISLRDQYSREKRKAETEGINGNAVKASRFPLFSQLSFLDQVIKRRRSYRRFQSNVVDEDSNNTYESHSTTTESSNEGNKNVNEQHIHNSKNFNTEKDPLKMKKDEKDEKEHNKTELEQTLGQMLAQMRHTISTCMEKKVLTADEAFMEFIKVQFNSIPEKEKNIRRKMIMDVLTAPLPEKY